MTPITAKEIAIRRSIRYLLIAAAIASLLLVAVPAPDPASALAPGPSMPIETQALSFITPSVGWRLASHRDPARGLEGPLQVERTADGGRTWRVLGSISPV